MAEPILTDDRWAVIAPLLPVHRPSARGACPHIPDRAALTGILFVLETGIQWADLPPEMGCGCGMRCWRRLRDWRHASDWERLHRLLLQRMREHDQIAWERASLGSASVPPPPGGSNTGPNPTDRGKSGCKHQLLVDQRGLPLVAQLSPANRHDCKMLAPLAAALPAVAGLAGRPRCRPDKLHADKGYDYPFCRDLLRQRGIAPHIARRGQESPERLGRWRWVVERTFAWLHRYRRLRIRYERRAELHQAFLSRACSLIR